MPIDPRIRDLLTEFDDLGMPGALREAIEFLAEEAADLRGIVSSSDSSGPGRLTGSGQIPVAPEEDAS